MESDIYIYTTTSLIYGTRFPDMDCDLPRDYSHACASCCHQAANLPWPPLGNGFQDVAVVWVLI
jgi:hypothetical protein